MKQYRQLYKEDIIPALIKEFGYKNVMEVPRLTKVVLSMGVKDAVIDSKAVDKSSAELSLIAGQKAIITLAKKSIATFKIRVDQPIGCKVTLRKQRMYEFLERLVMIALPRIRDFRGFSDKSFDGTGNFSLGIKEHIVFPEIDYNKIEKVRGLNITIGTTAKTNAEAKAMLALFNIPFTN